jgi:hypothetical protein
VNNIIHGDDGSYLSRAVPEFAHLFLVPHQLSVEFLDVYLYRGYPSICLVTFATGVNVRARMMALAWLTELIASWSVALGFLPPDVPNILFMIPVNDARARQDGRGKVD